MCLSQCLITLVITKYPKGLAPRHWVLKWSRCSPIWEMNRLRTFTAVGIFSMHMSRLGNLDSLYFASSHRIFNGIPSLSFRNAMSDHTISGKRLGRIANHGYEIAGTMMTSWHGDAFQINSVPSQKVNHVEIWCYICGWSESAIEQTVELSVIWYAIKLSWRHCNADMFMMFEQRWQLIVSAGA